MTSAHIKMTFPVFLVEIRTELKSSCFQNGLGSQRFLFSQKIRRPKMLFICHYLSMIWCRWKDKARSHILGLLCLIQAAELLHPTWNVARHCLVLAEVWRWRGQGEDRGSGTIKRLQSNHHTVKEIFGWMCVGHTLIASSKWPGQDELTEKIRSALHRWDA